VSTDPILDLPLFSALNTTNFTRGVLDHEDFISLVTKLCSGIAGQDYVAETAKYFKLYRISSSLKSVDMQSQILLQQIETKVNSPYLTRRFSYGVKAVFHHFWKKLLLYSLV
jgi:hypothetical protein